LRRFFSEHAWIESVVDFGHAKQIFEQADVFPSIIVARQPNERPKPTKARLCSIPREQLRIEDLSRQIDEEGVELPLEQLRADGWQLEAEGVNGLLAKIRAIGEGLSDFAGAKPYRGILTGFNDAFLIDTSCKDALVASDPKCADIMRPYVRGQDITRWNPDWAGLWMICLKSSENFPWPWADAGDSAEQVFAHTYPTMYRHLSQFTVPLRKRRDQGRYWWELRSCAYWDAFLHPKILYQDITWRSQFCLDEVGTMCNNTGYFLPRADSWVLAVLNSPVAWWFSWRSAVHGKDEALRFFTAFVEGFPVPEPSDHQGETADALTSKMADATKHRQAACRTILDWLLVEYEVDKPGKKLQSVTELDCDSFVAEVKKRRGKKRPLSAAGLRALRDEYAKTIEPARRLAAEALLLESQISDLVNEAYGLTPDEVDLLWDTAPPRMPIPRPAKGRAVASKPS
jgi:hypothetical protein